MATGRTVSKWARVYVGGYDLSGYTRSIGPLTHEFDTPEATTLSDGVKGYLPAQVMISPGTLNGVLDPTTAGLHAVASGAGSVWDVMVAIGMRAEPAVGDPVFMSKSLQTGYGAETGDLVSVTVPFGMWDVNDLPSFRRPWGWLVHAKGAETGVNSAAGSDDYGAATALGGYAMFQLFSSNGTVTLSVQDAAVNNDGGFAELITSGVIDASTTPVGNIVSLGATADVRRYIRWQLAFGTASTATFAIGFCRNTISI